MSEEIIRRIVLGLIPVSLTLQCNSPVHLNHPNEVVESMRCLESSFMSVIMNRVRMLPTPSDAPCSVPCPFSCPADEYMGIDIDPLGYKMSLYEMI
jgi:hypothetical protein